MNTGQLCVKHASRIVELINARVPLTVEGMPYARGFVYEVVGDRFSKADPLQCDEEYAFTTKDRADLTRNTNGNIKHFPELEQHAFEITKEVLPEIDKDGVPYRRLHEHIEDCI